MLACFCQESFNSFSDNHSLLNLLHIPTEESIASPERNREEDLKNTGLTTDSCVRCDMPGLIPGFSM